MNPRLPPPSWRRAVESDSWIAVLVLVFAAGMMAIEAFAR
jgi:hypothetical protein